MLRANTRYFRYHPVDMYATLESPTGLKRVDPNSTVSFKFFLHNQDFQRNFTGGEFTITITKVAPDGTETTLWTGTNPELISCQEVEIYSGSLVAAKGVWKIKATITPDSATGHGDQDGYTIFIWATLREDLNYDIKVDVKDVAQASKAFGSYPGHPFWDPRADINRDFKVDIKDVAAVSKKFGWH
jgi:hypothetical protein